jgi:F-type H+-transporting ATPase subunit a
MKRITLIFVLLAASLAFAQESEAHREAPAEKKDTAAVILGHVSDSKEMEFDIPLRTEGESPTIHFPNWRFALREGACPADEEAAASLADGCLDLSITKHSFMIIVASALLILGMLIWAHRRKDKLVPQGTAANLIELLVLFVRDEIAVPNIGKEKAAKYTPYLLSVFFFILAINLLGLFPWMSTATGNISVTMSLAVCTFLLTQIASFRSAGFVGYFKHLTGGAPLWLAPLMVPIEIIGMFTKPFALTLRLFANMLAGHIVLFSLLGLIFIMNHAAVAIVAVPFAVFIYLLELFVAFLQTYVFTMLSAVFIGMGLAMGHHEEHKHGHEGAHAA